MTTHNDRKITGPLDLYVGPSFFTERRKEDRLSLPTGDGTSGMDHNRLGGGGQIARNLTHSGAEFIMKNQIEYETEYAPKINRPRRSDDDVYAEFISVHRVRLTSANAERPEEILTQSKTQQVLRIEDEHCDYNSRTDSSNLGLAAQDKGFTGELPMPWELFAELRRHKEFKVLVYDVSEPGSERKVTEQKYSSWNGVKLIQHGKLRGSRAYVIHFRRYTVLIAESGIFAYISQEGLVPTGLYKTNLPVQLIPDGYFFWEKRDFLCSRFLLKIMITDSLDESAIGCVRRGNTPQEKPHNGYWNGTVVRPEHDPHPSDTTYKGNAFLLE